MDLGTIIGSGGITAVAAAFGAAIVTALLQQRSARSLAEIKAELSRLSLLRTSAEEKRAAVAAEGIVAILRFLNALSNLTSQAYLSIDGRDLKNMPIGEVIADRALGASVRHAYARAGAFGAHSRRETS